MAARKVKSEIKDGISGAVDGGAGGVGFGIPSDYGGRNLSTEDKAPHINDQGEIKGELLENLPPITAEPMDKPYTYNVTPIESEDGMITLNIQAEGVDGVYIDPSIPVVDRLEDAPQDLGIRTTFYKTYSLISTDNPVRQRAEKADIELANAMQKCAAKSQRVDTQKRLAAETLDSVRSIMSELIRVKNDEPNFEKLGKIHQLWIEPAKQKILDAGFKIDDVCPYLDKAVEKLYSIPNENTQIDATLDTVVSTLDDSVTHLEKAQETGYGMPLLEYYDTLSEQDDAMEQAQRMAADVDKVLKMTNKTTIKGVENKMATKQTYRLLENMKDAASTKDESGVPDSVPNYRLAIDASPRVCGNCRFFKGSEGVNGQCSAFDFTAKANYICDAWQSPNLTSDHTTVRSITKKSQDKTISEMVREIDEFLNAGSYPAAAGLLADMSTWIAEQNPNVSRSVYSAFDAAYHTLQNAYQKDDSQQSRGDWGSFDRAWRQAKDAWNKEASKKMKTDYPLNKKTPVEYVDTNPLPQNGVVERYGNEPEDLSDLDFYVEETTSYNEPEPPADNAAIRTSFLPNDTVYSKSLNSLGVVLGSVMVEGVKLYSIKLINNQGLSSGSGYTYESDLIARSNQATKGERPTQKSVNLRRAIKSDDPSLDEMVEETRNIYKALKAVCEKHADVVNVPLGNKDVLTPLREHMLKTLESPMFEGVSTGAKRKYYRAIQTALVTIGAARQVLFEGYKTVNLIKKSGSATAKSDMQSTMIKAQTDAYERVKYAFKQIEDALTLPSATHDMPAPGIETQSQ